MRKHGAWIVVFVAAAVLGGAACRSQEAAQQQKVDELQAQLDETKKQLAAKEQQAAPAEPAPADPAPAEPAPAEPQPAGAPARDSQSPRESGGAKPAAPGAADPSYVTAEQGQKAKEQYAQDKTKVKEAFAQQEQTNQQVQAQIEELKPREFTLPAGTVIPVRTTTELSTKMSNGSVFEAVLERHLVVGGTRLASEGANVTGVVALSDPGGRVKGVASIEVTLRAIAGVRHQTIRVKTNNFAAQAGTSKGRDAKRTGVMAGAGAVVGAIAGGGKGAAIGAGVGAATGVGTNMATKGKAAVIPAETLIEFTLAAPATVVLQP